MVKVRAGLAFDILGKNILLTGNTYVVDKFENF